ncbi:Glutamate receptor ionotropic, delta-1 [Portunus trituberculatus]|uniref:Glutamate receptor ionotropic, delta-1 n=1 Tax=Portunus trituberculatus TaxID=210409 RepID=A0A5B7CPP7_PORTR|nr:Glutamate receptor ionotropic, delta-1 [Portunus trituberculatus]
MHEKVVVCLLLVLLDHFAVGNFISDTAEKVNESADITDENLAKVMYLLADEYTPQCLWVVMSDNTLRQQPWRHSHLTLDPKEGKSTIDYINKNTERVTLFSCFTFLMTRPPDSSLMPLLTDSSNMQLTRYFIIQFLNESEAHEFLLDERLIDEENVAALVKTDTRRDSYGIMIRQLFHSSGSTQVLFVNRWEKGKGFDNSDNIFPEQMKNFYGTKMRGVTLDFRPFTDYYKVRGSRVVIPKPSLDVFMLEVIADTLNFTYELVMPEDGLWGYLKDDGHWVGVVGDVEFRRANFSLVLSLTLERIFSVDFTRIYYNDPLSFVTAKSRPSPPWLKLIKPFSSGVWLLALLSIVTGVILYYIIYRAQALLGTYYLVPSRAFMHIFGAFVNQSLFTIPWLSSGRGVPYRKTFDSVMAYCLQAGLIDKWERDLYSIYLKEAQDNKTPLQKKKEKMEADAKRNDGQVVLNLNHLQGPFLILLLGSASGVLLLLLEFVIARMFFAFPVSSRELPKINGLSPFNQKTLMSNGPHTPSPGGVVSGFDEKGNYVIRAVVKGN